MIEVSTGYRISNDIHDTIVEFATDHLESSLPVPTRQWRDFQAKPESPSPELTDEEDIELQAGPSSSPKSPTVDKHDHVSDSPRSHKNSQGPPKFVKKATGWYEWEGYSPHQGLKPKSIPKQNADVEVKPVASSLCSERFKQDGEPHIGCSPHAVSSPEDSESSDGEYMTDEASSTCSFRYGTDIMDSTGASDPFQDDPPSTRLQVSLPRTSDLSEAFRNGSLAYGADASISPNRKKSSKRKYKLSHVQNPLETSTCIPLGVSPPPDLSAESVKRNQEIRINLGGTFTNSGIIHQQEVRTSSSNADDAATTMSLSECPPLWDPDLDVRPGVPDMYQKDASSPSLGSDSIETTSRQHSRLQSEKLRQYATLYVEFSRDPWKWHDNRDFAREIMPRLEGTSTQESFSAVSRPEGRTPESAKFSSAAHQHADQMKHPLFAGRPESPDPPQFKRSRSPTSIRKTRQQQRRLQPLDRALYCEKCRRHFRSTWHMQAHLRDSQLHPNYCKICCIDWPTFKARFLHWADSAQCRPPEFEYAAGKPFMEILADAQRMPSRHDVRGAFLGEHEWQSMPRHSNQQYDDLCDNSSWDSKLPSLDGQSAEAVHPIEPFYSQTVDGRTSEEETPLSAGGDVGQDAIRFRRTFRPLPTENLEDPRLRKARPLEAGGLYDPPLCPICMIPLMDAKELLLTACGHVYCASCVLHYFSREKPNCRKLKSCRPRSMLQHILTEVLETAKCRTPVSLATVVPLELR